MTIYYQIGQQTISSEDVIPLLQKFQLLPKFFQECLIDQVLSEIALTDEEEAHAVHDFCVKHKLEEPDAQKLWMDHFKMTAEQMKDYAIRAVKWQKFKTETWGKKVESLFLTQKQQFDQVVYSLVRLDSPEIAQELYFRLQENEQSFAAIATEYSKGPEAQTGGLIGPIEVTKLHSKLAQMLLTCEPGKIQPPIRVDQWIVILKLERMIPATLNDGLRERLMEQQFQEWLRLQLETVQLQTLQSNHPAPKQQAAV